MTAPAQAATATETDAPSSAGLPPTGPRAASAAAPAEPLRRAIAAGARRLRWQSALQAAAHAGALALAGLDGVIVWHALRGGAQRLPALVYLIAGALPLCAALVSGLRRVPALVLAQRIDRSHQLADLIASGWAFAQLPAAERSRFMQAALERADALASSGALQPPRALPWRWPRSLWTWPVFGLALLGAARLPPLTATGAHAPARPKPARLLAAEIVSDQLRGLDAQRADEDAQLRELSSELTQLLERIGDQKIERLELLRALQTLEERLARDLPPDTDGLREQVERELRDLGGALARSNATGKLGAALEAAKLGDARAQLRELARRIDSPPDLAELQRLRAALAQNERSKVEQRAKAAREQAERDSSLLRKSGQSSGDAESGEQQRKRKRELDELLREERDRRAQQPQAGAGRRGSSSSDALQHELEQLERALADAAQSGSSSQSQSPQRGGQSEGSQHFAAQQSGTAARDLERAAQALDRLSQAEQNQSARERLQQRLAELRQLLAERRDAPPEAPGDASRGQPLRLEQFRRDAQGQPGQPGEQEADAAHVALLQRSGGEHPGEQPQSSRRIGAGEPAPSAEGKPAQGAERKGADANVDVSISGVLGRGPSRSSVIYDAASRGFGTRAYQKVHADYAAHAEQELEREPLPPGYRFYVRRYFDLIQPPEDRHE